MKKKPVVTVLVLHYYTVCIKGGHIQDQIGNCIRRFTGGWGEGNFHLIGYPLFT